VLVRLVNPPNGIPGKRPPAPSIGRRSAATGTDITMQIARELYVGTVRRGSGTCVLVGSWRDTLNNAEVLSMLREYNTGGKVLHSR
jgi:hypothetical protein